MNSNVKRLITNSSYAIVSNLLNLVVTSLAVLVLPKLIGVKEYGYWQLYLFYVSYVGFGHLGWVDGIYLRYGGAYYQDLNRQKFFSQFISYVIFQIGVAVVFLMSFNTLNPDSDKIFIGQMLSITLFLTNLRFFPIYLLQMTNNIKDSAKIMMLDRIIYVILLLLFIFMGIRNYQIMIYADILGRMFSLLFGIYLCRHVLCQSLKNYQLDILETKNNIFAGISLMLSNVASLLIIGIVRMGIESNWDVVTFANISLTLSISNLMMIFINAVGLVVFPMIKRMNEARLPLFYCSLRELLMTSVFSLFFFYFPIELIFQFWLPQYQNSLKYLPILFPLVAFEGKMALLLNTYLKAYRMEKKLFAINVITAFLSLISTYISANILNDLTLTVFSILILMIVRSVLAEYLLARRMNLSFMWGTAMDIVLAVSFALIRWSTNLLTAIILYFFLFSIYIWIKRYKLKQAWFEMKKLLQN